MDQMNLLDQRINNITRIAALNRGDAKVFLYDESQKKYVVMKGIGIDPSDKVISRLRSVFSQENIVFK